MCVHIPSTIQYMCRGSLLDGWDSCVTSFITQHTLSCWSKLAPPLTNSTTTSVLPCLAASMSAVSPSCAVTDNVRVNVLILESYSQNTWIKKTCMYVYTTKPTENFKLTFCVRFFCQRGRREKGGDG